MTLLCSWCAWVWVAPHLGVPLGRCASRCQALVQVQEKAVAFKKKAYNEFIAYIETVCSAKTHSNPLL